MIFKEFCKSLKDGGWKKQKKIDDYGRTLFTKKKKNLGDDD